MQPLTGIQILDASHVLAGPFASYQLVLLGAEVIRIDRVKGDDLARHLGGNQEMKATGLASSFIGQNANKSSIRLNYKDPRGVEIFKKLAARSDVVLENFRPGVMDKLGLGYDAIREVKSDIIYCSLTGFGPDSPMRDAPAYDHIVQGVSGLMSTTGTVQSGPLRTGAPISDYLAGLNAAFAMLSALYHRQLTGEGQHLQVTMLASTLQVIGAHLIEYQTTGELPTLAGNQPFSGSPFGGRFETSDGDIVLTGNTKTQVADLVAALGITTLGKELAVIERGRTLTPEQRANVSDELRRALLRETASIWEERLSDASVPAGKARTMADLVDDPKIQAGNVMDKVTAVGVSQRVSVPGLAFSSNISQRRELTDPERAGESTLRILLGIGLEQVEIDKLAIDGVVAGAEQMDQD